MKPCSLVAAAFLSPSHRATLSSCRRPLSLSLSLDKFDSATSSSNGGAVVNVPFHPLGPPAYLSNLPVGGMTHCQLSSSVDYCMITRLSSGPDVFLIRDAMSESDIKTMMDGSTQRGMKIAGTRRSEDDTLRRGSYLTWIDPYGTTISDGNDQFGKVSNHFLFVMSSHPCIPRSMI